MRQSYLKNAALLTGSDVVLRLAGMGLRILRPGCGLAMSAPSVLCAFQRWECHGWRSRRCCAVFSSPDGM